MVSGLSHAIERKPEWSISAKGMGSMSVRYQLIAKKDENWKQTTVLCYCAITCDHKDCQSVITKLGGKADNWGLKNDRIK